MTAVNRHKFVVDVSSSARAVHVRMHGDANLEAIDEIARTLTSVHTRVLTDGVHEVVVDLRRLDFMNSSCFKKFVTWLASIEDLDADARYHVRFTSNPSARWQQRSLRALQCFALDVVTVET